MKTKITCITIIVLFLLAIAGCTDSEVPFVTSEDFYTGDDGLDYDFFESSPPRELYEETQF